MSSAPLSGHDGQPGLSVHVDAHPNALVVSLFGSAGINEADLLNAELVRVAGEKPKLVVIDLGGLTFMNSLAVGAFLALNTSVKRGGGAVRLAAPKPYLAAVLTASKVDRALPIFATTAAALAN